jgi:hypothetical protein
MAIMSNHIHPANGANGLVAWTGTHHHQSTTIYELTVNGMAHASLHPGSHLDWLHGKTHVIAGEL